MCVFVAERITHNKQTSIPSYSNVLVHFNFSLAGQLMVWVAFPASDLDMATLLHSGVCQELVAPYNRWLSSKRSGGIAPRYMGFELFGRCASCYLESSERVSRFRTPAVLPAM
jgi:hypothetical protein